MKPDTDTLKILETLLARGAAISHGPAIGPLAAFAFTGDGRAHYCQPFPSDQHNVHAIEFDEILTHYGRDIELRQGGRMEAYLAPIEEWPGRLDAEEARQILGAWAGHLRQQENAETFVTFWDEETRQ